MEKESFTLSFDNVKGIPFEKYEKNFTFIVNDKRYSTSRYVADLLSPIIREYHYTDESIDSIIIDLDENENEEETYFSDFLTLTEFDPKIIDETHRKRYIEYFIKLGNIKEYLRLQPELTGEINARNVLDRLQNLYQITKHKELIGIYEREMIDDQNLRKMITYASSRFTELPKEKLKTLPQNIFEEIIKSDELKLDSEDELLNIIIELYEESSSYSNLFEYVKFENVRDESMSKFIESFRIDHIDEGTWRVLSRRLVRTASDESSDKRKDRYANNTKTSNSNKVIKEFNFEPGHELEGIMRHLTNETGGNIHDNGTIEISSNSIQGSFHPKHAVDYQSNNFYASNNELNAFVCFDFKGRRIQLTNYSIKSYPCGQNYPHWRNWVVEVSNDKETWTEIDRHTDDSTLNGFNFIGTFSISSKSNNFYRYIRLRHTGISWSNSYYAYFTAVEFFGKVDETPNNK